jgi:regulator of protease activity HflC (stomatin/prohibitin superfamily)
MQVFFLTIGFIIVLFVYKGIKIVQQQEAWIVEKLGKFDRKLEP